MRRPAVLIPALVALLAYAVTVPGTLIYDDRALIDTDPRLVGVREWGKFFTQSYNDGVDNLYRPVVSMTFAVQHLIHGTTAWPYHVVNVLLHALVTVMVALFAIPLCRRCEIDRKLAERVGLIAGLLFAVHPVHVEAVAGIVGRAEMLCAIGSIGLLMVCVSDRPLTLRRVLLGWSLFTLALFSKEQAMLLPVVAIATLAVLRRPIDVPTAIAVQSSETPSQPIEYRQPSTRPTRDPRLPTLFALVAATLAGYIVLREQILKLKLWWERVFLDEWIQPLAHASTIDRLTGPIAIAGRYLLLLFLPYRLHLDYGGPITPVAWDAREPLFLLGIAAVLLWVGWMIVAWRRGDRVSIAMLLAFAIVYGSIGNVATIIGVNVADRLMYLPSVFVVVLVALPAGRLLMRWPRAAGSVFVVVLALATLRTVTYAAQWNDRMTFYTYLVEQDPRSMRALLLVTTEGIRRNQPAIAIEYATRAVAVAPTIEDTYFWLGRAYEAAGDRDAALRTWARGAELKPGGQCDTARQLVARVSNP